MLQEYSQSKALWAITKASFIAIFSNPMSIVFSLLFPIIFILIFGAFGNSGIPTQRIAIRPGADTINPVFDSLKANRFVRIARYTDTLEMHNDLVKGKLTGVVNMVPVAGYCKQTLSILFMSRQVQQVEIHCTFSCNRWKTLYSKWKQAATRVTINISLLNRK